MSRADCIRWKEDGLTVKQISELTGRSYSTISKMYNYYGVKINREPLSQWDLTKITDEEDPDGNYAIGFLAADGYFIKHKVIACFIQERDSEILDRIKKILGNPDRVLLKRSLPDRLPQNGLCIGSVELVEYLRRVYGFSNTKSRTLPFPRHLVNPIDFLRGFMDGDGYIGYGCTFTCGSRDFVEGLLDWVWDIYGYEPNVQAVGQNKDCYNVTFRKKHAEFIHDLFSVPGLRRKNLAYRDYLLTQ